MKQLFKLKRGKITFDNSKIIIEDNHYMRILKYTLLTSVVIMFYNIFINISKLKLLDDEINLTFWIVITATNITILVFALLWSTKSSISLADVKQIKLKRRLNNTGLYIKLKNFQTRQVMNIKDADALKEYIEKNFDYLTKK